MLLFRRKYIPLNIVTVSESALRANHAALQAFHPEAKVCPVLKSNAYGHELSIVAPIFDSFEAPFLAVDSLYEAYELQKLKVETPILVMGYTLPQNLTVKRFPFHFAVFDLITAETLNKYQPGCKVHIFVDTGMSREGVRVDALPDFLEKLQKLSKLEIVGLCSHFSDADNPASTEMFHSQIDQFKQAFKIMEAYGYSPAWRHLSASGGAFKLRDPFFTMIRAGIAHYGVSPLEEQDPLAQEISLQLALEFVSTLAQVKTVPKGTAVGYNGSFVTERQTTVGLLPAGYYEGVDRRLAGVGKVRVRGRLCAILGKVSMNMTTIDLTGVENPTVGEKVVVYSAKTSDKNSLVHAAKIAQTIPYELMVKIAESVRRVLV